MRKLATMMVITLMVASAVSAQPGGKGPGNHGDFGRGADGHGQWAMQCGPGGGHGHHPGGGIQMLLRMSSEVGLSEDQQTKLEEMAIQFELEMVDHRATVQRARIHVRALMRDDDAKEADVMKAIDEATAAQAKVKKVRYQHRQAAKSILTEEQLDKIQQLRTDRFSNRWDDGPRGGSRKGRFGR